MGWLDGSDWSFLSDNGGTSVAGGQSGFSGGSFLGGDSGGGSGGIFSSFFGGGGGDSGGGTNWTGLLASGISSYAAGKKSDKTSKQQHKYDLENIAAAAEAQQKLAAAKAADDEKYYQLHGQQLKDAMGAYAGSHGQAQRPVGILSGYTPWSNNYGG